MTVFYEIALAELENSKAELELVEALTDEEACRIYNVDNKAEIARMLSEEIEVLEKEVEYLMPTVCEPEFDY